MRPTDVARDYLAALYHHAMQTLWMMNSVAVMRACKVDFVLTVPAVWTDAAKNRGSLLGLMVIGAWTQGSRDEIGGGRGGDRPGA